MGEQYLPDNRKNPAYLWEGSIFMELYIDDANVQEIRRLADLYPIDGVTTNPSILAKTGRDPIEVLKEIRSIIGREKTIFVQVIPLSSQEIIQDAHAIVKLMGERTVVKIPSIPEGFKAIRQLKTEDIRTCGTVVYTPLQACLAAKAGADYVAPYVNRIDNMGFDGVYVVCRIQDILTNQAMETKILAASFKNSQQVLSLCEYGIKAVTCAPSVIDNFVNNSAIDKAVSDFRQDFFNLTGENSTMSDLIGG